MKTISELTEEIFRTKYPSLTTARIDPGAAGMLSAMGLALDEWQATIEKRVADLEEDLSDRRLLAIPPQPDSPSVEFDFGEREGKT